MTAEVASSHVGEKHPTRYYTLLPRRLIRVNISEILMDKRVGMVLGGHRYRC